MKRIQIATTLLTGSLDCRTEDEEAVISTAFRMADAIIKHDRQTHKAVSYAEGSNAYDIIKLLSERLDCDMNLANWRWMQASALLIECGIDIPSRAQAAAASSYVKDINGNQYRKSAGKKLILCPPLK